MSSSKNPSTSKGTKVKAKKDSKTPDGKAKKQRRHETYSVYIYKVLKQVHQDTRISLEASKLVRYNKKHTLSAREIQSSVKLLLPGELAKHAIIEGAKAVNKISESA